MYARISTSRSRTCPSASMTLAFSMSIPFRVSYEPDTCAGIITARFAGSTIAARASQFDGPRLLRLWMAHVGKLSEVRDEVLAQRFSYNGHIAVFRQRRPRRRNFQPA